MESCVGKIGDEFDAERAERSVSLADALSPVRVILDLQAGSMSEAIENSSHRSRPVSYRSMRRRSSAPCRRAEEPAHLSRQGPRRAAWALDGIDKPVLAFARCAEGVPQKATSERAELLFLLLTPTGLARIGSAAYR